MGSGHQRFGAARRRLAQAVDLFGHCRRHRVLADRRLQFPADPIFYSDRRGRWSRRFDAHLVHLAWAEIAQSGMMKRHREGANHEYDRCFRSIRTDR